MSLQFRVYIFLYNGFHDQVSKEPLVLHRWESETKFHSLSVRGKSFALTKG